MSLTILQMSEYPNLMQYLPFAKKRYVASKICQAVVSLKSILNDKNIVIELIKFINPLLCNEKDYVEIEQSEFEEEQQSVAKLVHLVQNDNPSQSLEILMLFQKKFLDGEIKRMKYTIPSLIFSYMKFARLYRETEEESVDINGLFKNLKKLIGVIEKELPETALKLYLEFVLCVNNYDKSSEVLFF